MRDPAKVTSVIAVLALSGVMAFGQGSPAASAKPSTPTDQEAVKEFESSVKKYLDLRKTNAGKPPRRPTDSPEKLSDKRHDMAEKIRGLRSQAKQGDIFSPEVSAYFRRQIAATLAGPQGAKIVASLKHAEPLPNLTMRVNESYPEHIPLQSTPPSLLLNLPPLPNELEYRIVGRNLVLHDVPPNIIVDYIPNAIPQP
jgi:hypothetical protein